MREMTDGYITMKYHYNGAKSVTDPHEVIEFKTSGISKIIDYGRSFFYANKNVNSTKIYDVICKESQCGPKCGSKYGYGWTTFTNKLHITSSKRNISHDLRLINELKMEFAFLENKNKGKRIIEHENVNKNKNDNMLQELFDKLIYGAETDDKDYDHFGTSEIMDDTYPMSISNVSDAHKFLKNVVSSKEFKEINNAKYKDLVEIGTLDIWVDGKKPMVFSVNP
jgi:hypothetical protein